MHASRIGLRSTARICAASDKPYVVIGFVTAGMISRTFGSSTHRTALP